VGVMLLTKTDLDKKYNALHQKNQHCNNVITSLDKKNQYSINYKPSIMDTLLLVLNDSINKKNDEKKYWQELLANHNEIIETMSVYLKELTESVQNLKICKNEKTLATEIINLTNSEKILVKTKSIIKASKITKKRKLITLLRKQKEINQSIINWLHSIRSPIEDLFNEDILEKNQESLFKQYQLYVEMSDRISSRRSTMNNFFLSANSLFLVAIGILVSSNLIQWSALVFIVAILFTFSWWRLIKYYRELNKAKFEVINKIEEKLPAKGFTVEWEIKKTYKKPGKHSRISFGEMWIPKTLIVVYFVFLIIVLVWIFSNIQTLFSVWLM